MEITEKVSYLKGLIDGLGIDEDSKEGKIFAAIVEVLDEVAASFEDVVDNIDAVDARVDEIDEDLGILEEEYYGEDGCDCGCDDDECDCCGDDCDGIYYEAICPGCGEELVLPEDVENDDEIICPECGEHFEIELDDICDHCDCEECDSENE